MSKYTATTNDRETLTQIAALFLSFAKIAERASLRCSPIRWLLLWILRPAEARARNLVMEAARDLGSPVDLRPLDNFVPGMGSVEHLLRLALSFEMLAALLENLAALAGFRSAPTSPLSGDAAPRARVKPLCVIVLPWPATRQRTSILARTDLSNLRARAPPDCDGGACIRHDCVLLNRPARSAGAALVLV